MRKGFVDPSLDRYPQPDQTWFRIGLCKNNGSLSSHVARGDKGCAGLNIQ